MLGRLCLSASRTRPLCASTREPGCRSNRQSLAVNFPLMSETPLSERDVCTKLITPAVERVGWDIQSQVREEVSLTAGRVMVRGRLVARGTAKRADYVLYLKPNLPLAVIEAKEHHRRGGTRNTGDRLREAESPSSRELPKRLCTFAWTWARRKSAKRSDRFQGQSEMVRIWWRNGENLVERLRRTCIVRRRGKWWRTVHHRTPR